MDHAIHLSHLGYGYTRKEFIDIASDTGHFLGFSPEHTPPKILTEKGRTLNTITSPRSTMVTYIGAASAIGNAIPPFLIFKGKRQSDDLKVGATPGCGFAMSDNGWSNAYLLKEYFQEHFLKYVNKPDDKHILVLFDGASTHMNIELIDWAKVNIILFVHSFLFLQWMIFITTIYLYIYKDICTLSYWNSAIQSNLPMRPLLFSDHSLDETTPIPSMHFSMKNNLVK